MDENTPTPGMPGGEGGSEKTCTMCGHQHKEDGTCDCGCTAT
jgi:hypothetical protein